ncbi:MAG: hypothetical protein EPN93_20230 [Spirochaetes bacterium]|nr:MAG: hypothetical protein EPN93_20230 [Spirochaetota bacterium]
MKKIFAASLILCAASLAIACGVPGRQVLPDGRAVYAKQDGAALQKKNVIEGHVRYQHYENDRYHTLPVKGAVVEIKNANMGMGYYRCETDGNGYFHVEDFITQVRYVIEVRAEGFVTYRHTQHIQAGTYDIQLTPEAIISGTVKDSAGGPMRDVEVRLNHPHDDAESGEEEEPGRAKPKPFVTATDARGLYRFDKLTSGSYAVTFQKQGYITETARLQHVSSGEKFNLPMQMLRPARLSGRLSIEGIDAPAINVDATLASGKIAHSTQSYQDGSYQLEDVKPGTYKLSLSHQGFFKIETPVITVREGDDRAHTDFTMRPKSPELEVYSNRYTFAPGSKVEFSLKSFRLEKVKFTVYRVPVAVFLRGKTQPGAVDPATSGFRAERQWDDTIREFEPYEWRYQSVEMNEPLPPGGYCIEVTGADKVTSRKFFSVTSVGVVVKRSRESVFAYVTDLVTNAPVPGAAIALFDNTPEKQEYRESEYAYKPPERIEDLPVAVVQKGATDVTGVYHAPLKSDMHVSILAVGTDGSYSFCSTGSPNQFAREENKFFIYTDRPVYRAGDKVHYKILGKHRAERFVPLGRDTYHYEIRNIDTDDTIDSGSFPLDEWGTFHGDIQLSSEVRLGEYELRAGTSPDDLYAAGRFYVEQYRKPEFKIELTPTAAFFTNGDTAEFKVEARYFFGAPLKGALVRYRFYESRLRDTDTTYWWEEDYGRSESYNKIKLEGEKYLDDNGIASLKLHCGDYPYDREITLETTIVDSSNVSITSRESVKIGRGEYYIKINPAQNFFSDDEKKIVQVKTLAHDGKPVSAPVEIKVYRYVWKPWQRVYVHDAKPVFEKKLTTGEKGTAELELPGKLDVYGEFDIVATGRDKKENVISANRVVWIYSNFGYKIESRFKNLELAVNDAELEKPGEITCLLKSRFNDAWVCITLEGRDVYESRVVKMTGNITPVKLDIKARYAPNLFITATMQRNRALFMSSAGVSIPDPDTGLTIAVKADREKYLPGDTVKLAVKAADTAGRPVQADISLGVVDEAIYQIRYDHTPRMRDFFYSKISNWVLTNYSYPITILAGAGKEGKIKVRENFKDTAFWKPDIRTGADGNAELSFTVPDNLTTWRLTLRGHDREGRVGEKKSEILVTQDLVARIGKPRFFTEGDRLSLIGIVNSNTARGLEAVATEFKMDGTAVSPEEKAKISLPAFGSARAHYQVQVPGNRESVDLYFQARADAEAKDALKLTVPVQSKGVPYKLYGLGDMSGNREVTLSPLGATDDFEYRPETLTITVHPDPIAQLMRASKYLAEYPYGCVEQTISRFLPNLAFKALLAKRGMKDVPVDPELDAKISVGIQRITQMQNDDGSWGWWSGDRGNEFITGYVLYALRTAKGLGYPIDGESARQGLEAVERMLQNESLLSPDGKAYLLYIYAFYGKWSKTAYAALAKESALSNYAQAFLVRAMALAPGIASIPAQDRAAIAKLLPEQVAALKNRQQTDGKGAYWAPGENPWAWQGASTEMSAHVLAALVESGDTGTIPASIVASICKRMRGGAWTSTKETAHVFFAFCKYLEARTGELSSAGNITFSLEGKDIATLAYDTKTMRDWEKLSVTVKLPGSAGSAFKVAARGSAGPDALFELALNGNLNFKDTGFLSLFKSEDRSVRSLENGISLARRYYSVMRVRDANNSEYFVPEEIGDRNALKVGDELLVKIKFRAQDNFEYLVLEDYLPSGFEVVMKNAYGEYQPFSHAEQWDNRMVFFFTGLEKNRVYEIAYIMRAELPGEFLARPSRMECMYEPSIQGWASPSRFVIQKK